MTRRGFALIAVLWLVAAMSALLLAWNAAFHVGHRASHNRMLLERARWAAEACLAIVEARWSADSLLDSAPVDLGRGTQCRAYHDDPATRLNVNTASGGQLMALAASHGVPADSAAAFARQVLDARAAGAFTAIAQLEALTGARASLLTSLTVEGDGRLSTAASERVLATVPGLTDEAIATLHRRAEAGRAVGSLDELLALVSPASRAVMLERTRDLRAQLAFRAERHMLTATGWVNTATPSPVAVIELAVGLQAGRLAIFRRRMW